MKPLNIPVVALGPGSQPTGDMELQYLELPQEMTGFVMPEVPRTDDRLHFAEAREIIRRLVDSMGVYRAGAYPYPRLELGYLDQATVTLVNDVMREGEVSALIASDKGRVKIQETVFAGVWRILHYDRDGRLVHDYLEACPIPEAIVKGAQGAAATDIAFPEPPPGVMNSPSVLFEIREHAKRYGSDAPGHVVNLTLLPFSAQDNEYLIQALPPGPVAVLSRGYGKCRVSSTALKHAWRVQYFNNMDTLILNTIEVVDVPEVVRAAAEDLEDSLLRLQELLDWMEQE